MTPLNAEELDIDETQRLTGQIAKTCSWWMCVTEQRDQWCNLKSSRPVFRKDI